MTSLQKESEWEKEFQEFFGNTTDPNKFTEFLSFREVKEFIGLAIETAVSNREKEIAEEVEKKVWLMRQWLNEDRITDGKKMVSNEDLLYWLNLNK